MIDLPTFYRAIAAFKYPPDSGQKAVIEKDPGVGLQVVAGPGSGKTTSLTYRILKLVLVDGIAPSGIVATTFTKKAAGELRSRVLGWGFRVIDLVKNDPKVTQKQRAFLAGIDINQVWTGTVDSLCEQLLRDYRAPGTQPPVLADEYVAKTLLLRDGLFPAARHQADELSDWLLRVYSDGGSAFGFNIGTKVNLLQTVWDRRFHDQVDWPSFVVHSPTEGPARQLLDDVFSDHSAALDQRGMLDFASLENEVLVRLRKGQLDEFRNNLRVVLVDEYQDTNLLQEQIYFELASACDGALCVVGDDDQSLYRFRGATVDLFSDFAARYQSRFRKKSEKAFLSTNYRSTKKIIKFVDKYARLDAAYQAVRIAGKPKLSPGPKAEKGFPVLGMFRDSKAELASDLGDFIHQVFRGRGYKVEGYGRIKKDSKGGDLGDCALLCSSPNELSSGGKPRLPLLLREHLAQMANPIPVFNPRGQDFASIEIVAIFGGLLLECIDPTRVQDGTSGISQDALLALDQWREIAIEFVGGPHSPAGLEDYATGWVNRDPGRAGLVWPRSVSVLDLMYGLVHFLPKLHDDPEGQVYLELFFRQLAACEQVGKFKGRLVHEPAQPGLGEASIKELVRDFLAPIASGTVRIDEELIEAFPRDQLSILSIHQSKGLEFPLTIVDVGSDFTGNYKAQRFKRFPESAGTPHRLEDIMRACSPLARSTRSQLDRAFDDLYRQYFVAFSRAENVLLLVGVRPTFPGERVQNVATGWDRLGVCHWVGENLPFLEI